MREIKFRVWDSDINEWVYGGKPFSQAYFGNINETTLGEYTGLKDKNGVEIYEGDIVQTPYGKREVMFGKIGYDNSWNGLTGFYFKDAIIKTTTYSEFDNRKEETLFMELGYGFSPLDIEVIGNIHEQ